MNIIALIVTYNRLAKLKHTWEATASQAFSSIVIVNNNSSDGTIEWLSEIEDERLNVINSFENMGGAGGIKTGAEYIANHLNFDWVVIYDDDAYPDKYFVENFISLTKDSDFDAVASKVINKNGEVCKMNLPWKKYPSSIIDNVRYFYSSNSFAVTNEVAENIVSLSFVGCVIKAEVLLEHIDNIKSELFIYYDDVFFSWYLHLDKKILKFSSKLVFIHDVNAGSYGFSNEIPDWKLYYLVRNLLLSRLFFGKKSPFSFSFIFIRLLKYFLISIKSQNRKSLAKVLSRALWDGLFKRNG